MDHSVHGQRYHVVVTCTGTIATIRVFTSVGGGFVGDLVGRGSVVWQQRVPGHHLVTI